MPSKLEESWKRGLAQASTTDAHEQLRASPTAVGSAATAARSQSTKPGADGSPLLFGSPALSPGLSWPLGLGWLAARPVRLTPESPLMTGPSQQASQPAPVLAPRSPRRCPAPATSSLPILSPRPAPTPQEACSCPALVSMPMMRLPCCVSWRGCVSAVGLRRRGWYAPRSLMRCSGVAWRTPLSGCAIALSRPSTA